MAEEKKTVLIKEGHFVYGKNYKRIEGEYTCGAAEAKRLVKVTKDADYLKEKLLQLIKRKLKLRNE